MYGKNVNLHWKSSKFSLALQPEALVNMSAHVDFSSPELCAIKNPILTMNFHFSIFESIHNLELEIICSKINFKICL